MSRRIAAHVHRMMGREARCLIYWPVVESKSVSFIRGMKAELFHQWAMGKKLPTAALGKSSVLVPQRQKYYPRSYPRRLSAVILES